MVESTIRYSKSGSSDIASNSRRQTPFWLQRLKRRKTLFQSPNTSGRPRQGEPVRTIQSTPSTNIRLSRPVDPFWSGRPMIRPDIRSQSASSNKLYRSRYAASRVNLSLPIIRVAPGFRSGGFGAPAPLAGLAAIAARRVRVARPRHGRDRPRQAARIRSRGNDGTGADPSRPQILAPGRRSGHG